MNFFRNVSLVYFTLFKGIFVTFLSIGILTVSAWLTHVVHCINHEQWGFLIAGGICFPVAIVHGIGLWFGFFH